MTKKVIAVDMDGILVNLLGPWLGEFKEATGRLVSVDEITEFHIQDLINDTDGVLDRIIKTPGFFQNLPALPGAVDGFNRLRETGHTVIVCTNPPSPIGAQEKYLWCEKHLGITKSDVIMASKKWMIKADVLIDDGPSNIKAWKTAHPDGQAYSISYPYNQEIKKSCHVMADCYKNTDQAWRTLVDALCG